MLHRRIMYMLSCSCLIWVSGYSQGNYKLGVTYYDYHADGSNLEFGVNAAQDAWLNQYSGRWKGLVDSLLDADKKIKKNNLITNPTFYVNHYINHIDKWFRTWTPGDTIKFFRKADTLVTYTPKDTTITPFVIDNEVMWYDTIITYDTSTIMVVADTSKSDTTFKNIILNDSLLFSDVGSEMFQAGGELNGDAKLFPIDGRGFKNEDGSFHNNCFALELSNRFTFHANQKLVFGADDDGWVFINNKLAIDLGGFHGFEKDSLLLNTLGLTEGQQYEIKIFWVDRCEGGNLLIKSNLDFTDRGMAAVKPNSLNRNTSCSFVKKLTGTTMVLEVPYQTATAAVEVFDMKGQKTMSRTLSDVMNSRITLTTGNGLSAGTYMVAVFCYNAKGTHLTTQKGRFVTMK